MKRMTSFRTRWPRWLAATSLTALAACATMPEQEPASRNVILFLGDGMGVSTVTAARIFEGQRQGLAGEEHALAFEHFPHVALVKTYNTDGQVPDSAGTMSAIMTGEKTRVGHIAVGPEVDNDDCPGSLAGKRQTLLEEAELRGYATGIVSTARITHATPAATYAHVPNRNWEADSMLPAPASAAGCRDIAAQLVEFEPGDGIDVILGGGRAAFRPAEAPDPEYPDTRGMRADQTNLVERWSAGAPNRRFVWNAEQLDALDPAANEQVLGLFEPSHMQFEADRARDAGGEPSLAELTRFAIERLQGRGPGYFLMIEGGRIDHAHHFTNAYRALVDTLALSDAVATAMAMTDPADTLILVTADHSHTLTISGYPKRGNPILGKVETLGGTPGLDAQGRPYTTLGYANGPSHAEPIRDLTEVDTTDPGFQQPAGVPLDVETHSGEDVAAYALGLNAEALGGVIEQNALHGVMREALFGGRKQKQKP
ncbi:MAG TPA: alkaline phosphatase [Pseudomonadales bacterium]